MKSAIHAAIFTRPEGTEERSIVSRGYGLYLLAFATAYVLLFCQAIPTFIDEAYSYNLATDRSLAHMFAALRDGADGSFPLYALIVYGWEKVFGASELSLRLNGGVFVLLFVWHSSRRLAREFGVGVAALAILFVLADEVFTYYVLQARFYGLVIFLFSLCFWGTWDLLQSESVSLRRRFLHALFCGLLCLSHPLGLVYTGILGLLYFVFSVPLKRFSSGNGVAFLGGPALFLVWLPSFLQQRLVNPGYTAATTGWLKYWQFAFFYSKLLFFTLVVGLLLFLAARWVLKSKDEKGVSDKGVSPHGGGDTIQDRETVETVEASQRHLHTQLKLGVNERRSFQGFFGSCVGLNYLGGSDVTLLVLYSTTFIVVLNVTIAVLDWGRIIPVYWMLGVRYLLVCWVAYAVVLGAMFANAKRLTRWSSERYGVHLSERIQFVLGMAALLFLMESRWSSWLKDSTTDKAFFATISRIANEKNLDVVCESHKDAFYLATRTPTDRVQYLLGDDFEYRRLMLQIAKYYPRPAPLYSSEQAHYTNEYLYLAHSPRKAWIVTPTKGQVPGSD